MTEASICQTGAAASTCLPFYSIASSSFFLSSLPRSFEVPPAIQMSPCARGSLRPPAQPRRGPFVANHPCWSLPVTLPLPPPRRCLSSTSFQSESTLFHWLCGSTPVGRLLFEMQKKTRKPRFSWRLRLMFKAWGGAPHPYKYACPQTTHMPCKFTGRPNTPGVWTCTLSAHVDEVLRFWAGSALCGPLEHVE